MHESHPAAKVMPPLPDIEYAAMVESIKKDGLIYPIKLIGDLIIDGNHRQKACFDAGVEPRYEQVTVADPARYVMSCDKRRHLTTRQRAAIAAELANMKLGSNPGKGHIETEGVPNGTPSETPEAVTLQEAADLMSVGRRSAARAKKVMRENPEAHEQIKRGEKVKGQKEPRESWWAIATAHGLMKDNCGGVTRKRIREEILSIDPGIVFATGGQTEDVAQRIDRACAALALRRNPTKAEQEARAVIVDMQPQLSQTAQQKLDAVIRAHKRMLDAEFELRLQERIKTELEVILPDYAKWHQRHVDVINAYDGVLTHGEYKFILGLLHSDKLPGLDDVQKARFDKGFNIFKQKQMLLCGLRDGEKLTNTMPKTLAELLAMRKKR